MPPRPCQARELLGHHFPHLLAGPSVAGPGALVGRCQAEGQVEVRGYWLCQECAAAVALLESTGG